MNENTGPQPGDDATQQLPPTPPTQAIPAAPQPPAGGQPSTGTHGTQQAHPAAAPAAAPEAAFAAQRAASPATARRRAPWIVGGALAGVLVLGGAVGAGVAIGRSDEGVTVQRITAADTGNGANNGTTGTGTGTTDDGTGTGNGAGNGNDGTANGSTAAQDIAIAQDDDVELTGDTLTRAATAAMQAAGGEGVITSAEVSDDPTHVYEVEVTRTDRMEMDVYLDADYQVVATKQWH